MENQYILKDIAEVAQNYEDQNYIARLNMASEQYLHATEKMNKYFWCAKQMQPVLENFQKQLPKYIKCQQSFDNAASVHNRLDHFTGDFGITILFVLITLLPLGFRASLVVMISIPLSLVIGFVLIGYYRIYN